MRLTSLVLVGCFFSVLSASAADSPEPVKNFPAADQGQVDCFDYYHFGSVQVDLSPTLNQTVPGATLNFQGTIKNENAYPIVDGSVYVKIFRKSEENKDLVLDNGYPLVDQFLLPDTYTLPAKGEKPAAFDWTVPMNAAGGEYYAAFFFQSARHYNLLGLSFTDDVTGNQSHFTVTNPDDMRLVTFNKNTVTLNGQKHRFANFPLEFKKDESVIAKVEITNPKTEATAVSLLWKHYAWDALRPETLADTQNEIILLQPGETRTVEYAAQPLGSAAVSYVVVEMHDGISKSFLDIRFARVDIDETNVNFPSIMDYPLKAGVETGVFSCIHGVNLPVVTDNILTLTLRDMDKNIIHTYKYRGDVTSNMMGFVDRFVPEKTYTDFTLTATLERKGQVFEDVTQTYRCQDIDPSLCPKDVAVVTSEETGSMSVLTGFAIVGVTVFLGFLVVILMSWKKRRGTLALFFLALGIGIGFSGVSAEAKSVAWSDIVIMPRLKNNPIYTTVLYEANAYSQGSIQSDGTALPVGTVLNFQRRAKLDSDIFWFVPGGLSDSPFGAWDRLRTEDGCAVNDPSACIIVQVNSPTVTITHTGTAGLSCWNNGFNCTVTSPGTIISSVNFAATTGLVYVPIFDIPGAWPAEYQYAFDVSAQSISFFLSAFQPNSAPNAPVLAGPASGNQNASLVFSATATDPDGDNIRYLFDWNNDGIGDQWTTGGAWVASGTAQSLPRIWASPGTYTFQARTQDSKGSLSGWTQKTVTINAFADGACGVASTSVSGIDLVAAPVAGLCNAGTPTVVSGSGPWTWSCNGIGAGSTNIACQADLFIPAPIVNLSIDKANVDLGDSATLTWSVVNPADTCVASSIISASWNGARATSGSESVTPTASGNYILTCTNTAEGKSGSNTVGITLNNKLKICENSCNSGLDRTGQTFAVNQGEDRHLKACFNPHPDCTNAAGNTTNLAVWNDTNSPNNAFSFPAKGELRPLPFNATEDFDVSYGGVTKSASAQVFCVPNSCSIPAAKAVTDTYCPETVQDTNVPTGCDGNTLNCPGTRHCDYNVKEVAP
ncbi:MAG: hypothetical protein QG664_275 [Patescibacteria group bacterium]|nr:hypothetical protein [Patescibacteria group bacterium]